MVNFFDYTMLINFYLAWIFFCVFIFCTCLFCGTGERRLHMKESKFRKRFKTFSKFTVWLTIWYILLSLLIILRLQYECYSCTGASQEINKHAFLMKKRLIIWVPTVNRNAPENKKTQIGWVVRLKTLSWTLTVTDFHSN